MINQIKSFKKRTIVIVVIASLAVVIPIMYLIHNSSTDIAAPLITKDPNLKVEIYSGWIQVMGPLSRNAGVSTG
jgi:hypothetical protein